MGEARLWDKASRLHAIYSLVKMITKKWRHQNDRAAFQPHCRFCFDSISVAVRLLWDSPHLLFIALCVSRPSIRLAFLSCQARLAVVCISAGFLERCIFLFALLEVCHKGKKEGSVCRSGYILSKCKSVSFAKSCVGLQKLRILSQYFAFLSKPTRTTTKRGAGRHI